MSNYDNLELFLHKYLETKNITWLELFIFEFYQRKQQSKELLLSIVQGNESFSALSFHMSYHLLKQLFSTICDLMTSNTDNADSSLRNFLTNGLGSRIITMMSTDLDLTSVANERELVIILCKIFPMEPWELEDQRAYLSSVSRADIKKIFKKLWLLDPLKFNAEEEPSDVEQKLDTSINLKCTMDETKQCEDFFTTEFNNRNEKKQVSSSQLGHMIIDILKKLVQIEKKNVLEQTDQNSVTMSCLSFSLETLGHLQLHPVFNEDDQTVIKAKLMELTFLCFNNLVNRDGKAIETVFKKLFNLLERSDNVEISCGLIVNILVILNNLCVKKSIQKTENMNLFILCNHLILRRMEILSTEKDLLQFIHLLLIRIIRNVRNAHEKRLGDKNKKRKRKTINTIMTHHDSLADSCVFEKLLIESFSFIKSFSSLKKILNFFCAKDICCCNGTIETARIFMKPSTVPMQNLIIIREKIIKPMFDQSKICIFCNDKRNSEIFKSEYFQLLRSELQRRQGWELHVMLRHLCEIQRIIMGDFLDSFLFGVIVPTFVNEKNKYLKNPEDTLEAKLIVASCLDILNNSLKADPTISQFFTMPMIRNLKDCSLIPVMASQACHLLKIALDHMKLVGATEDERENINKMIYSILFSNVLFLTHELIEIYSQIDLPKDVSLTNNDERIVNKNADDFEILAEQVVAVKEALSDTDVLFLNTIHWNILCDLISKDSAFQQQFVANIFNNFNGNILFTIAYNALNSILLKKELNNFQLRVVSQNPKMSCDHLLTMFERCDFLIPVLAFKDDLNYERLLERCYHFYEISGSYLDKLRTSEGCSLIYQFSRDNDARFRTLVHRNIFLSDNVTNDPLRRQQIVEDHITSYQHWLNQIWVGIFDSATIRDRVIKVINRFLRTEEELKAIYRVNVIREITGKQGIKYLSSIARNCFDICWRLSDNISFTAKMSTALEELKLLLLQDNWDENKEVMVDALQLLLGVAEMKTCGTSRMMFMANQNFSASSESMFSDFNSSLERDSFEEKSDGEDSTDKKTETSTYYTADENYDADEEFYSNPDTELSQSFRSLPATLGFRNTNEHICKLVVEILMDLCKRCIEKPEHWQPNLLIPLAQRLSCMKAFLGGSLFLIKGFSSILQSNDEKLTELQKTILDLIENVNSPDSFKALLSVLTVKEAAIGLIMNRLETFCKNEIAPKPCMKVDFPTFSSVAAVTSTCDSHLHKLIQSFRDVHLSNKLLTPFTEASQIIPLNFLDFKPWNNQGFTVTAWIELIADAHVNSTMHLMSLGTEKLMMAVYVNSDGSFTINVVKPNQNFSDVTNKFNKTPVSSGSSNKENVNKTNIFGIALATLKDSDVSDIRTRGFIKNVKKKGTEVDVARRLKTSKISMKSKRVKVKSEAWSQVCFSARSSEHEIMLLITVNGTEQELIEIPIEGMCEAEINGMLQLLCIGAQKPAQEEPTSLKYSISNVMLFRSPLETPNQTSHLYSLGPNCDSLIDCEAVEIKPLLGQVDFRKATKPLANVGSEEYSIKLKSNVLVIYSAGKANGAIGYKTGDHGRSIEMFTIGEIPSSSAISSLARAIQLSGGVSTILFLFARTIEMTADPFTQSSALYVLLKMSYENNHLFAEFEQKNLFNLISHVFKHSNCYRGPGVLKAILDVVYGGTIFIGSGKSEDFLINERSELCIEHPNLLFKLFENFEIFQSPEKDEANILDLLFKSLMVVVRETHPYKHLNRQCLADYDFHGKLIEFCKIHLANSANSIAISSTTALVIVELMKMLSKDQPVMWTIKEIQKLLLLMHHPSESFVTHDRTKFHFILPGNKPTKSSKLNLSTNKGSKYFNFSIKIRSTSTNPTSPKTNSPPRTPRSPYDSVSMFQEASTSTKSLKSGMVSSPNRKASVRKFDELSSSQAINITKAMANSNIRKELKTPTKIHLRRLHHPKRSVFKNRQTPDKSKKKEVIELSSEDEQLAETFKTLMSAKSVTSIISEVDLKRYDTGVSVLQENLLMILRNFIILLDDAKAEFELPECLKMEMLIMFSNHHDANVRAAIVELIEVITSRESLDIVTRYEKSYYWTHLGNQLSILPVNMRMAQACVDWICFEKISLHDISRSQKIQIKYKPAFSVLISMIPSMVHDAQLIGCVTKFLRLVLEIHSECLTPPFMNALISSAIKALVKMDPTKERVKNSILIMLEQIASRSLTTSGSIQPLWDLLYGLSFVERQKKREVVREVHVTILKQLVSLCVVEQNRRGSRGTELLQPMLVVTQLLGSLPASEIKTRFNLIHDRAVQFVCSWDSEELAACEVDFVKFLIDLHFSGIHQGSSILLWSLNPTCEREVKSYFTHKLSQLLDKDANFVVPGNDNKLLKSLLFQYLNDNVSSISPETTETITKFCGLSGQQQLTWSWSMSAVEKVEAMRHSSQKDQNANIEKIVYKLEAMVQACVESAMKITRSVIDVQNKERRQLMNHLKKSQEIDFYREWFELIQRMVHEDAPWYNQELYPSTWELDETEGPGRTRIRLKRVVLQMEERFFGDEFQQKASYQHKKPLLNYLLRPKESERYSIQDRIVFTFNAKHLTLELEILGEIIVTDNQLIFLANTDTYTNSIICDIKNISEILDRRYQHKEIALEIFLATRKTFFIIFETNYERDIVKKFVSDKIDKKNTRKIDDLLQKWVDGRITNFEYLIELNKLAGRSYNDLMQYPVFPWILSDYQSDFLDLKKAENFRRLNKTISTQHDEMEEHYVTNYKYLAQSIDQPSIMKPYHYSSHYSNSGTILHFLVRLPPFTSMFLLYQDHNFDIPDRTFHSLATTFKLTSKESATDVKELVPEFFYLFDFFENSEGFNFGKRQSGDLVNDVKLPPWCEGSPRLFMLIHRQALESSLVRKQLNHWIDLIFGFKQKGNAAVNAINVFHPATYPEFQLTNVTDVVERSAYETMIRTYGQMPKQIFTSAHKKANSSNENITESWPVLKTVKGLRWGAFTGSPQLFKPIKIDSLKCGPRISKLVLVEDANVFYGLPEKCHLMRASKRNNHDLVLWSESDGVVRVKSLKDESERTRKLFHISSNDPVTACGSHVKHSSLWFGHESGNISVYVRMDENLVTKPKERNLRGFNDTLEAIIGIKEVGNVDDDIEELAASKWNFPIVLVKHRGDVLDLKICVNFKIVVSIGIDGRTVIWDAQKIEYIRTIEPSCNTLKSQLTLVDISPTLGDVLTVFSPRNGIDLAASEDESFEVMENSNGEDFINVSMSIAGKSQLRLHTINAKYINHTITDGFVTAACFSFIKEGTGVNVIAAGFENGTIRMYSTWTLEMIREIATEASSEITEILFTTHQHLAFLAEHEIQVWESDGLMGEPPKFNSIVLY